MTCPAALPLAFTQLTEPQQYATPTGLPAGFDPTIALLLGNCCNLAYSQFASGTTSLAPAQIAGLWSGNTLSQLEGFTLSEAIAAGAEIGTTGEYVTFPVGFALTGSIPGRPPMNIIALRGTRTYNEWINDAEAIPAPWHVGTNNGNYYPIDDPFRYGMVHGGFYNLYNQGSLGTQPTSSGVLEYSYSRPIGSIAQQIYSLLTDGSPFDSSLPLYITGHSLGAALATLCAMDVGINMPGSFPAGKLYMYNLASPLVAAGISAYGIGVETSTFVSAYNAAVANSYRVVHAPDIVPIMPPGCTDLGTEIELDFAHVTSNVVDFCAQTGSIGGNHACADTYVPYLQQLFEGF
jgi:Lipase (class 3).